MENGVEPTWVKEWVNRFLERMPHESGICPYCHLPMLECESFRKDLPVAEHSFSGILPRVHCEVCLKHGGLICLCAPKDPEPPSSDPMFVAHREAQGSGHYRGAPWPEQVSSGQERVAPRWWQRAIAWTRGKRHCAA